MFLFFRENILILYLMVEKEKIIMDLGQRDIYNDILKIVCIFILLVKKGGIMYFLYIGYVSVIY